MRLVLVLAFALPLSMASTAHARTPLQERFHTAFSRMNVGWPNVTSHDYWLALRDAEDAAKHLSDWERESDPEVVKDLREFEVYRRSWVALQCKERAVTELLLGQLSLKDHPDDLDGAREHFAIAVAMWDEAFRLWPFLQRELVRGDTLSPKGQVDRGGLVVSGAAWRQLAQRHADAVTPK